MILTGRCKDFLDLSLVEARQKLERKEIGAVELTEACIEAAENSRSLNVFITETFDVARQQARVSEGKLAKGQGGLLEGIPLGIKDLFCTKGIRTTAGSRILENFIPPYESTVTQNLLDEGAVFLGKLNMDEFAMGSAGLTSYFGPVVNPLRSSKDPDKALVPGGSSSGASASVAAKLVFGAPASDTGGSIRQPAAFTGTVGIKPTYGLCSRYGMVAFASSLDQAGPITRTVRDSALMLSVMASYDTKDSTSLKVAKTNYLENLVPSAKGVNIGIPKECLENLPAEDARIFQASVERFQQLGATFSEISLTTLQYALCSYYIIAPAEASSNLARYDGVRYGFRAKGVCALSDLYGETRHQGFGKEVQRRILIGTYVLSRGGYESHYIMAQKVREKIIEEFAEAFQTSDLILMPTTIGPAFGIDEGPKMSSVDMYLNDVFTVIANMAGLPGISVPSGKTDDGLPMGVQLIGPRLSEQLLFNAAAAFEDSFLEGHYGKC